MTTINVPLKVELFVTFDTDGEQVTIDKQKVALVFKDWLADIVNWGMGNEEYDDSGFEDILSDTTGWCVAGWGISYDVIKS